MNSLIWNPQQMVRDFHEKFDLPRAVHPDLGTYSERQTRGALLSEEYVEVMEALREGDLAHIARELADLLYVTYGTAVTMGIDMEPVFEEVNRANMAKVGGTIREDGKLLKPEGWQPPDIQSIIRSQVTGD